MTNGINGLCILKICICIIGFVSESSSVL